MNGEQFRAFVWLRWRLILNQMSRGGLANTILTWVILAFVAVGFVVVLAVSFVGGLLLMSNAPSLGVLALWDALVVLFLFVWLIGLVLELQRSEPLSLTKFLHLPVSLSGVFLINYLSSLFSPTLLLFLSMMLGLSLGLAVSRGPFLLLLLPLLAAFLFLVTALTYQLQGWLASLMTNPRRRRTVIVTATLCIVLLTQLPNLINLLVFRDSPRGPSEQQTRLNRLAEQEAESKRALDEGKITAEEHRRRGAELAQQALAEQAERNGQFRQTIVLIHAWLPPAWLPLGGMFLAEGNAIPALLGTAALALLGSASLWRAYRTTVRLYTGQFTAGKQTAAPGPAPAPAAKRRPAETGPLERRLPGLSGQAAVTALAGFRSLLRAPEAKMLLLTPFILVVVFGSVLLTGGGMAVPEGARPFMAVGAMAVVLLSVSQLIVNQFGFDRGGFRVFVLCPAPRRDILLGKNLAVAPLALVLALVLVVVAAIVYPMRVDQWLAVLPQFVSMYLLLCLLGNVLSIIAPIAISPGTMKPVQWRMVPTLLQLAFVFVFPLVLAPVLLPPAVEWAFGGAGPLQGLPISLALSLAEAVAVVALYNRVLTWEGRLLHAQEQNILAVVASRAE